MNRSVIRRRLVSAGIVLYVLSFLLPAQEFNLFTTASMPGMPGAGHHIEQSNPREVNRVVDEVWSEATR